MGVMHHGERDVSRATIRTRSTTRGGWPSRPASARRSPGSRTSASSSPSSQRRGQRCLDVYPLVGVAAARGAARREEALRPEARELRGTTTSRARTSASSTRRDASSSRRCCATTPGSAATSMFTGRHRQVPHLGQGRRGSRSFARTSRRSSTNPELLERARSVSRAIGPLRRSRRRAEAGVKGEGGERCEPAC